MLSSLPFQPRAAYNACGRGQDCGRDTGQEAPFPISSEETPALRQAAGEPSLADGEGAQTALEQQMGAVWHCGASTALPAA